MFDYGEVVKVKGKRLYGRIAELQADVNTCHLAIERHSKTHNTAYQAGYYLDEIEPIKGVLRAPKHQSEFDFIPYWLPIPLIQYGMSSEQTIEWIENLRNVKLYVRLFNPAIGHSVYIAEYDPNKNEAYGWVTGWQYPEWANFDLSGMAKEKSNGQYWRRDLTFQPCTFMALNNGEIVHFEGWR